MLISYVFALLTNGSFFLVNQEVAICLTLIKYAYLQRITETYGKTQSPSFATKYFNMQMNLISSYLKG